MVNVKICMMIQLIQFYLFISLSVILTIFQGHRSVCSFNWKFSFLIQFRWNFVGLLSMSRRSWIYHNFWWSHRTYSREIPEGRLGMSISPLSLSEISGLSFDFTLLFPFVLLLSPVTLSVSSVICPQVHSLDFFSPQNSSIFFLGNRL